LAWNAASRDSGIALRPVRWERDAIPTMGGRPQQMLNEQFVDSCDLGIAIFWTRLGTPTGEHQSGTVEELRRLQANRKPVLVYVSTREPTADVEPEQRTRVQDFLKELQREAIVQQFGDAGSLRALVFQHLSQVMPDYAAKTGTRAVAQVSAEFKMNIEALGVERGRPEFAVEVAALSRQEQHFTPEFKVRQISGATIGAIEYRISALARAQEWRRVSTADLPRARFTAELDLGDPNVAVGDAWLQLRFVWEGTWHHERHRWPIRRLTGVGKVLWEMDQELLPPKYWTSDSSDDSAPN